MTPTEKTLLLTYVEARLALLNAKRNDKYQLFPSDILTHAEEAAQQAREAFLTYQTEPHT